MNVYFRFCSRGIIMTRKWAVIKKLFRKEESMNRKKSFKGLTAGVILGIVFLFSISPVLGAPPIKIGMITDLSGMAFTLAKPNVDGAQMAADEVNKAGGILGRKIEILVRDSALK